MSVYLDIKSLYPHLKVNWNVLLCKICIARRLVVDIFPWCNAHYVPFPSGTLVARRMGNGSIFGKTETYALLSVCGKIGAITKRCMMSRPFSKWGKVYVAQSITSTLNQFQNFTQSINTPTPTNWTRNGVYKHPFCNQINAHQNKILLINCHIKLQKTN